MNDYTFYDAKGEVISAIRSAQTHDDIVADGPVLFVAGMGANHTHYVDTTGTPTLYEKPSCPSPWHEWDWLTYAWVLPSTALPAAISRQQAAVDTIRYTRQAAPITSGRFVFDADAQAIANIQGVTARIERGDGLTAGWLGWRTFDNSMVWADSTAADVLAGLHALARDIEDREQAVLIAAWQHKAMIAAADSIEAIEAYDITAGWPT